MKVELISEFFRIGSSSFTDFVSRVAPDVLPSSRPAIAGVGDLTPHGTTIVAATFPGGVVVAGDRRATMGNIIAQRDIEKVFAADEFSIIGIAGAAGLAVELVGLFQVELEHYEKIEGAPLSLVGKANRLATMIRLNLGLAMQGLVVVPVKAGSFPTTQPEAATRSMRTSRLGPDPCSPGDRSRSSIEEISTLAKRPWR